MQTFEEAINTSHLHPEKYRDDYMAILECIHFDITNQLRTYDNFNGIDFCDVGANGIQIRGHHKEIERYCYGNQITIKYDFNNWYDATRKFIKMWEKYDNNEALHDYLEFITFGEKFNWD